MIAGMGGTRTDAAMRRSRTTGRWSWYGLALAGAAACGPVGLAVERSDADPDDRAAVLEFGSPRHARLRDALVARGVIERPPLDPVVPPRPPSSDGRRADGAGADSGGEQSGGGNPAPDSDSGPGSDSGTDRGDAERSGPADGTVTSKRPERVQLQESDTLSDLCERELGRSKHWRRVAEFNGWSEEDLLRLRPGTWVRIPPELR